MSCQHKLFKFESFTMTWHPDINHWQTVCVRLDYFALNFTRNKHHLSTLQLWNERIMKSQKTYEFTFQNVVIKFELRELAPGKQTYQTWQVSGDQCDMSFGCQLTQNYPKFVPQNILTGRSVLAFEWKMEFCAKVKGSQKSGAVKTRLFDSFFRRLSFHENSKKSHRFVWCTIDQSIFGGEKR
jgi:hypothetical protein